VSNSSKYKTHAARGTLTVGPSPQNQTGGTGIQFGQAVEPSPAKPLPPPARSYFLTPQTLQAALKDLRAIRDQKLYLSEGAHSFRQWAIQLYGERFGIWLDETL